MPSKATLAIDWPVFKPRGWGLPTRSRALPAPWYGLDTERDSLTGNFVCGWAVGDSIRQFQRLTDLESGTYWVWNLEYDIEGMLRDLAIKEGWAAKADGASFPFLDGSAVYYHKKRFDFRSPSKSLHFIEAASFFGRQPLSAIGAKENVDASQMSLARYLREKDYRERVDSYCQQDARIVFDAINRLNVGLRNIGVEIGSTPGATARRFLAKLGPFPEVIWETHKAFLRSYCGGRFEITKRGVLHDVRQYDIVSAYPWALANCPWLTSNAISRQTRHVSDNALYGSYEVSFRYENYLGLAPRWKRGIRVYSTKEDSTWLTLPEINFLQDRGADFHIWRGVEIFDDSATELWKTVIEELFDLKKKTKLAEDKGWGAKIVLNSQYGVLIQLIRRSGKWVRAVDAVNPVDFAGILALEEAPKEFEGGKYFAPVYAANLTALTRVKLLEAAEKIGPEDYIGGHTDSILTTGRIPNLSGDLGGWELKEEAKRADICKTGMYGIGESIKLRGITRKGRSEMLWEETHLRKSRIGIKSAATWDEVSVIMPKTVANNYAVENKRLWHGDVTRGLIAMERFVDSEALSNVTA